MSYWVYIHTCTANGKKYVGCTKQARPELRWGKNGERYKGQLFGRAILKHGWNNFQHEAWELTCESEMYYAEKYLIAYYHTTENEFGYNRSIGGESGSSGCRYSEEGRKKLSEAAKKRCSDPEYRKKMSEAGKRVQKKVHSDPEYLKKASEAAKKGWLDPEIRRKKCEAQKKLHSDPGYRKKISEALKGRPKPKVKIKLPDGTIIETTKHLIVRWYVNKGKEFEYVS